MSPPLLDDLVAGIAPPIHRLTVRDLETLLDAGTIAEGEPIELIDGMLVVKDRRDPETREEQSMSHGPRHAAAVRRLQHPFHRWLPNPHWHVSTQLPIELSETQAPEPDVAILRGTPDAYDLRHPRPRDVVALAEVSGTSLRFDRSTKQRVYAVAGIMTYVIVDLASRTVEVLTVPDVAAGRYQKPTTLSAGEVLRLELPGTGIIELPVAELFPAEPA